MTVKQQYLSRAWVERHYTALHRVRKQLMSQLLQSQVQRRLEVQSGYRRDRRTRAKFTYDGTASIYFDKMDTRSTTQIRLVLSFESALPHGAPRCVSFEFSALQFDFTDLANVADHMSDRCPRRITAPRMHCDNRGSELGPPLLYRGDLTWSQVISDHNR